MQLAFHTSELLEDTMSQDNQLQQAVIDELSWEPSVAASNIGVTAKAGVITLTGHVGSFFERYAAEKAAGRVKGVKAVAEEIEVRLSFDNKRDDADIAAAALERLAWDSALPKDAVKVKVEKGWVTLTGQLDWYYQKSAAEENVRGLMGVIAVSNQITLKPTVNIANISDNIAHALHRNWFFEPKKIQVSAESGNVHLKGHVHSWHDFQVATATAWSAPGTTSVDNQISIN
jgi:osmotically-inducible protein OsmY